MIPFSLLWGGFVVFWFVLVRDQAPLQSVLVDILLSVAAAYVVVGRFFHRRYRKRHIFYALTDHRALILQEAWPRSIETVDLATVWAITIRARRSGFGHIFFGEAPRWGGFFEEGWPASGRGYRWSNAQTPARFLDLRDANEVYRLVEEQRDRLASER